MKTAFALIIASLAIASNPTHAEERDYSLVDLTHTYDDNTLYWPTSPTKFQLTEISHGQTEAGWFYSAYSFCTPEHGGTHLDAPVHFSAKGASVDALPLERLVAPGIVIDVRALAASNRDYLLSRADVMTFEEAHGQIEEGTIVLLRTGWSRYWPDAKAYLGDDTPGDATKLSFPSYGEAAARFLVEQRKVAALGVDTASIDSGNSRDFAVHRIAAASNVAGLENLTGLDQLPVRGFRVIALPMKIRGGSGGPARVIALLEHAGEPTGP
jgi:kynurenine formamidase